MKICVCSDSHGNIEGIRRMLETEKPDGLLFCGDGIADFSTLELPEKTMFVSGNCDAFCDEPIFREFVWDNVRIIMAHGHRYSVKRTEDIYLSEALAHEANVAVYGHTHIQKASYSCGVLMLNPGTLSRNNGYYALLYLKNGVFDCRIMKL